MAKKNSSDLIALLRRMWLIRAFEEKASALYAERQIVGLLRACEKEACTQKH